MTRPEKRRIVKEPPKITGFKPVGIPARLLENVFLSLDEYEAIRLADFKGLEHVQAAEKMNISRPTFTRIIKSARKKIAQAIIGVKQIVFEGGNIRLQKNLFRCYKCGKVFPIEVYEEIPLKCPNCHSDKLINLAHHFGFHRGGYAQERKLQKHLSSHKVLYKEGEVIMPRRDGTGPDGRGPRTGRGLGPCGKGDPNRRGRGNRATGRGAGKRQARVAGTRQDRKE